MSATQTTNLGLNKPDRQDYVSVVSDINQNMDRIDSSVGNIITPVFSPSTAYSVGDYVIYNRELYRFTTAHPAGNWNSSHVAKTNLAQESNSLKSAISKNTGSNIVEWINGKRIFCSSGSTISPAEDSRFSCAVVRNISPGDVYYINASTASMSVGSNYTVCWGSVDTSNILTTIQYSQVPSSYLNRDIVAPSGANVLILNNYNSDCASPMAYKLWSADDRIKYNAIRSENPVKLFSDYLDISMFTHEGMNTMGISGYSSSRIINRVAFEYDRDIILTPSTGFRVYLKTGETGQTILGWKTAAYTIPAKTKFFCIIARVSGQEVPTEYADIEAFVKSIKVSTVYDFVASDNVSVTEWIRKISVPGGYNYSVHDFLTNDTDYHTPIIKFPFKLRFSTDTGYIHRELQFAGLNVDSEITVWPGYKNYSTIVPANTPFAACIRKADGTTVTSDILTKLYAEVIFGEEQEEIPSYYTVDDYIQDKVKAVQKSSEIYNGVSFVWFTDAHVKENNMNSASLINYVLNRTTLTEIVYGGDTYVSDDTEAGIIHDIIVWNDYLSKVGRKNVFQTRGNHDINNTNDLNFSLGALYSNLIKPIEKVADNVQAGKLYYTIDNKVQGFRIIVVDMYEEGEETGTYSNTMTNEQLLWICDKLNTDEFSEVLLVGHQTCDPNAQYYLTSHEALHEVLKAFVSRSNLNFSNYYNSISYDFREATANFVAMLHGHSHFDACYSTDGVLSICTDCDSSWQDPTRDGTIHEQVIDFTTIDTDKKTIDMVRVGDGDNRKFNYEKKTVNVSGTLSLTTSLTEELTWTSSDGDVATVSSGTVFGVSSGSVIITASDGNGNDEMWLVIVS